MASSDRVVALIAGFFWMACASSATVPERPEALRALDGTSRALEELTSAHEATVLVWWSSSCPCVRRYQERILDLRARYPSSKVAVALVCSGADEKPDALRRVLEERGVDLPMLLDPGARLAGALEVGSTPSAVILDRRGRPVFRGWIDNERERSVRGRLAYVENALDAILAGTTGFADRSPAYGCPIPRSLRDPNPGACHIPPAGPAEGETHDR